MSANPAVPSTSTLPANLTGNSPQATAGSRESSEFEFVGNNGSGQQNPLGPPATLKTDQGDVTSPIQTNLSPPLSAFSKSNADVLNEANIENSEDEGLPLPGLFGWVKGTGGGILSKVAEKTKSSMETVITTLDPQVMITQGVYFLMLYKTKLY